MGRALLHDDGSEARYRSSHVTDRDCRLRPGDLRQKRRPLLHEGGGGGGGCGGCGGCVVVWLCGCVVVVVLVTLGMLYDHITSRMHLSKQPISERASLRRGQAQPRELSHPRPYLRRNEPT